MNYDEICVKLQKELKTIGIKKSYNDIWETLKYLLETYDNEDRKFLLTNFDELLKEMTNQYKFEENFDKEFGKII